MLVVLVECCLLRDSQQMPRWLGIRLPGKGGHDWLLTVAGPVSIAAISEGVTARHVEADAAMGQDGADLGLVWPVCAAMRAWEKPRPRRNWVLTAGPMSWTVSSMVSCCYGDDSAPQR